MNLKKAFNKLINKITETLGIREVDPELIDEVMDEIELDLYEAGVIYEVIEKLRDHLKNKLVGQKIPRGPGAKNFVLNSLQEFILDILKTPKINLDEIITQAKTKRGFCLLLFLGFNGVGKSLTLCKVGYLLKNKSFRPLVVAGDTFRSAAIDQLEGYALQAKLPIIKSVRGADSCALIYDATKSALSKGYDVVLADTAGRSHTDMNLMRELEKIVRVNSPDLKILVLDSLTGSDILSQFELFDKYVGVDALIFTKLDAVKRGGPLLSAISHIKKPILFVGTGQKITDLEPYNPEKIFNMIFA